MTQADDISTRLEVDDLYFIFDQPQFIVVPNMKEGPRLCGVARTQACKDGEGVQDLSSQIRQVLDDVEMSRAIRTEFTALFERADNSRDVQEAPPGKARDIRRLLKTMQLIDALIDSSKAEPSLIEFREPGHAILTALSALAEAQTDDFSREIVERYRQSFPASKGTEPPDPDESLTDTNEALSQAFLTQGEQILVRIAELYQPILNPASYIDDYIRKGILRFEQSKGITTALQPDSKIWVEYYSKVPANPNLHPEAPTRARSCFTLTEIVTGQYLYEAKSLRDRLGREYREIGMEHKELIDALTEDNLQSIMERELKAYRDNPANAADLKSLYQGIINSRCLAYLSHGYHPPLYAQAVKDFLEGKLQAQTVFFHNVAMNGVFLIPAGPAGGVIFSVDDDKFFHFGSSWLPFAEPVQNKDVLLTTFPRTKDFTDWVFSRIPAYDMLKHEKDQYAFEYEIQVPRPKDGALIPGRVTKRPLYFTASQDRGHLVNQLYDGLMKRLESDIDTLVFSRPEQITEAALELAKKLFAIGSIALSAPVPGTGLLLARISLFMASLALDGAYVLASVIQSDMSDRPEHAAAFRNEAMISGVLGVVGAAVGGWSLISQGASTAYLVKKANQTVMLYRHAKAVSRRMLPPLLGKMNWGRLSDLPKVDLLVDSTKKSLQASSLAQLTDLNTVQRSIRNNLLHTTKRGQKTRFAWGDYVTEKINVEQKLSSDLARLRAVNSHVDSMVFALPDVLRRAMPGGVIRQARPGAPEDAAAKWIAVRWRSDSTSVQVQDREIRIKSALTRLRQADLFDIATIESLHDAAYRQLPAQTFRPSSNDVFIGSDIARAGFEKMLARIKAESTEAQVDLADALYAAVVRYRPFVRGDDRTARAIYALARLKNGDKQFMALRTEAERILKRGRAMSPKPVKPRRQDFPDEDKFKQAMKDYLADKGTLQRMEASGSKYDELANRRQKAVAQLEQYKATHPELHENLLTTPSANFTLTSMSGDPADILVLSAHGWYTKNSDEVLLPAGKDLVFLGPHGKALLEPPGSVAFLPTQKLLDGTEYPKIYAKLKRMTQTDLAGPDYNPFTELNGGVERVNYVKNYHVKHYEKIPEEEVRLAVLGNRISGSQSKMDLLTVDPMAGNKMTLSDVLAQMKPSGMYSNYKQLVFAACREEKRPGTLVSVDTSLGGGYEIRFTNTPLRRDSCHLVAAAQDADETPFDGYWVYEEVTLEPTDRGTIKVGRNIREVLFYVVAWRP